MQWYIILLLLFGHYVAFYFFATPRTVFLQAPLSMEFPRQEYLEWVAISFSRGSSQPMDRTLLSCIGRQILYQ